jgi:predicted ferric reductase
MGYIDSEFVEKNSLSDLKKSRILLCGPKIMMKSLESQFLDLGIKPYNIIYEEFSLR